MKGNRESGEGGITNDLSPPWDKVISTTRKKSLTFAKIFLHLFVATEKKFNYVH